MYQGRNLIENNVRICSRCIYDGTTSGILFDSEGVCNYCHQVDQLQVEYQTGQSAGQAVFETIVANIKRDNHDKPYDIIVGVSGGTDSSYILHLCNEYGLRPLAVHYDNTWNTAIATNNIRKITQALNVDLHTHVCDNKESDDIFRSFFLAGVPELDAATDIALAEVMYRAASQYGIRTVFEGHSFLTEGISPLGTAYVDGGYIDSVHRQFGERPLKTFPNMRFWRFLYWVIVKRIQKIRPLWYLRYSKAKARQLLQDKYGWEYYG